MNEEQISKIEDKIETLELEINLLESRITEKREFIEQLKDMILNLRYN